MYAVVLTIGTDIYPLLAKQMKPGMTHAPHERLLALKIVGDNENDLRALGAEIVKKTACRPQPVRMIGGVQKAA